MLIKFLLPELKQQTKGSGLEFTKKMKMALVQSTKRHEQELEAQIKNGVVGFDRCGHGQSRSLGKQSCAGDRKYSGRKAGEDYRTKHEETRINILGHKQKALTYYISPRKFSKK